MLEGAAGCRRRLLGRPFPRRALWPVAALFALVAVLAAAAAVSQATFTYPPIDISSSDAEDPQVALDADGDGLVVWRRRDATGPCSSSGCFRIRARARSAAGVVGPVQTLSDGGQDALSPQMAMDAAGDALMVWSRRDGVGSCSSNGCFRVQARARSAAGVLGPVQTLSPAGEDAGDPRVAVDADGDALVVWSRPDGTTLCPNSPGCSRIQARARSAGGALGPVQTLSGPGRHSFEPEVAIDVDGDAVVVWQSRDGTGPCSNSGCVRIRLRARSAGGVLGSLLTLSAGGQDAHSGKVAIDRDGDALVVWERVDGIGSCSSVGCTRAQARARSAAGTLGPVQTLSPSNGSAQGTDVAIDADGDALVAWGLFSGSFFFIPIEARPRSAAGTLGPVETLSDHGVNGPPQLAAEADGDAVAVWAHLDGFGNCDPTYGCPYIQARTRSAGGTLGLVQPLTDPEQGAAGSPQVAADANADALAVWLFGLKTLSGGGSCCARVQASAGP